MKKRFNKRCVLRLILLLIATSQISGCASMAVLLSCMAYEPPFDDYKVIRFKLSSEVSVGAVKSSAETFAHCTKLGESCAGGAMYVDWSYAGDEQLIHNMGDYTIEVSDGGSCNNLIDAEENAVMNAPSLTIRQGNDSLQVDYESYRYSELQQNMLNNNYPGLGYEDFKIKVELVEKR